MTRFALFAAFLLLAAACSKTSPNTSSTAPASSPGTTTATNTASSSAPAATTTSGGSFEGNITARLAANQQLEMNYAVKGAQMRVETVGGPNKQVMAIALMNTASGEQTVLMPPTKTYMTMNWNQEGDQFTKMAERMAQRTGQTVPGKIQKITATGQSETIAGYSCDHWRMTSGEQVVDLCLTKALAVGSGTNGLLAQLKNLPFGNRMKEQLDANPEFARFIAGGAFPLRVAQVEQGESKTILEVTNVAPGKVDDAQFAVPPDYKKVEVPQIPVGK